MNVTGGNLPQVVDAGPRHGEGERVRVDVVDVPVETQGDCQSQDAAKTRDHSHQETIYHQHLQSPGSSTLTWIPDKHQN